MRPHASALVLEDNEHMRFLLAQLLHELDVEQIDAVASIDAARSHVEYLAYDFALVDVGLLGENGLDFIKSIRLDPSHPARRMPMIVVSGQNQLGVVAQARDAGADGFLAKPVSPAALAHRLKKALDQRRVYVETETYFGPDRRRGSDPHYQGPERRKRDDAWYL